MATQSQREYRLEVSLDASSIADRKSGQAVQVVVQDARGKLHSARATITEKGSGDVSFTFPEHPGSLHVIVGPHDATPEEMTALQTVVVDLPKGRWGDKPVLKLPIIIPPYYWFWWLRWCRDFVIHGRVICPDGSPVPGATVCAFDVDWFLFWNSSQQIGCATTDINGAFTLKFRWCCGWWPWWWWRNHYWQLDPLLVERIAPVLQRDPDLNGLLQIKPQPSLAEFRELLGAEAAHLGAANEIDPAVLETLREPLLKRLPPSAELEQLHIWPWYPWYPWFDCTPDVIFKVRQNCNGNSTVIVDETIWNTRWDIPTTLNLTLVANDKACCLPPHHLCAATDCLDFTMVCGDTINHISGNIGASPTPVPVGYHNPEGISSFSDQPYADAIPIYGTIECLDTVDYYEFEWSPAGANSWNPMPPAANGAFTRTYLQLAPIPPTFHPITFSTTPFPSISDGIRNVYETLLHYQNGNSPADWNSNRWWIGQSRDQLINWLTAGNFADGTYDLRIKGWNLVGGVLNNKRILQICAGQTDANLVLRVDNRVISVDPHGNPCGGGTVHICTNEPDTAIVSIKILKAGGGGIVDVLPCGSVEVSAADTVVFEFVAYDPDGHLAQYSLQLDYGLNQARNLLNFASPVPDPLPWSGVPMAAQAGPNYLNAIAQGALRPTWKGGVMQLTMPATGPNGAFPVTCCYVLRLDAYKRTIVDCNDLYRNTSETSFTITVV